MSLSTSRFQTSVRCDPPRSLDWLRQRLNDEQLVYRFLITAIYAIPVMTFTMPGLDAPSARTFLDPLAMVKAGILAFALFGGAALVFAGRQRPAIRFALATLSGFFLYVAWSITSTLWSPLKVVTLGQSGGLLSLLLLSVLIAGFCRSKVNVSRVMWHLCYSLIAFATIVLVFHFIRPMDSGLDRTILHQGGDGLVHPTAAGASASLGLLLATISHFILRFPWAKRALLITVLANGVMLYFANSRSAILMAGCTIPIALYVFGSLRQRGQFMLLLAALAIGYLVIDPGFHAAQQSLGAGLKYLARGQDVSQLREASGRVEMWTAIWHEYLAAPIIGHGYFVTSRTGKLYVWNTLANHTAHNIYLQVLVTTGLIGMLLFILGIVSLGVRILRLRRGDLFSQRVFWMLLLSTIWFSGWSLGCVSFIGPIRSESVIFFCLLGIAVGELFRSRQKLQRLAGG